MDTEYPRKKAQTRETKMEKLAREANEEIEAHKRQFGMDHSNYLNRDTEPLPTLGEPGKANISLYDDGQFIQEEESEQQRQREPNEPHKRYSQGGRA